MCHSVPFEFLSLSCSSVKSGVVTRRPLTVCYLRRPVPSHASKIKQKCNVSSGFFLTNIRCFYESPSRKIARECYAWILAIQL